MIRMGTSDGFTAEPAAPVVKQVHISEYDNPAHDKMARRKSVYRDDKYNSSSLQIKIPLVDKKRGSMEEVSRKTFQRQPGDQTSPLRVAIR